MQWILWLATAQAAVNYGHGTPLYVPSPQEVCYPSGLRVLIQERQPQPIATVSTLIEAGRLDEDAPGSAHLLEHLWFRRMIDGVTVRDALEQMSAVSNAMTSDDYTVYEAMLPTSQLRDLLRMEALRWEDPLAGVSDDAFEQERAIVRAEMVQRVSGGMGLSVYYVDPAAVGHRGWRPVALPESVLELSLDDTRDVARRYGPHRSTLMITSNLSLAEVKDLVAATLPESVLKGSAAGCPTNKRRDGREERQVSQDVRQVEGLVRYPTYNAVFPMGPSYGAEQIYHEMAAETARRFLGTTIPDEVMENGGWGCNLMEHRDGAAVGCFIPLMNGVSRGVAEKAVSKAFAASKFRGSKSEEALRYVRYAFVKERYDAYAGRSALQSDAALRSLAFGHFVGDDRSLRHDRTVDRRWYDNAELGEYVAGVLTLSQAERFVVRPEGMAEELANGGEAISMAYDATLGDVRRHEIQRLAPDALQAEWTEAEETFLESESGSTGRFRKVDAPYYAAITKYPRPEWADPKTFYAMATLSFFPRLSALANAMDGSARIYVSPDAVTVWSVAAPGKMKEQLLLGRLLDEWMAPPKNDAVLEKMKERLRETSENPYTYASSVERAAFRGTRWAENISLETLTKYQAEIFHPENASFVVVGPSQADFRAAFSYANRVWDKVKVPDWAPHEDEPVETEPVTFSMVLAREGAALASVRLSCPVKSGEFGMNGATEQAWRGLLFERLREGGFESYTPTSSISSDGILRIGASVPPERANDVAAELQSLMDDAVDGAFDDYFHAAVRSYASSLPSVWSEPADAVFMSYNDGSAVDGLSMQQTLWELPAGAVREKLADCKTHRAMVAIGPVGLHALGETAATPAEHAAR